MPELPEVETTMRGITPYIRNKTIINVIVRQYNLRWPIPSNIGQILKDKRFIKIKRRAKYILLETNAGHIILHLGMSGSLRIIPNSVDANKHDHVDIVLSKHTLRFHDPRRFGALLWTQSNPLEHKLLANLGPEPLGDDFNGKYLHAHASSRKTSVKNFIMNNHIVVGVGNIYASEALFLSSIHPQRAAGRISLSRYELLAQNIKSVLNCAIKLGGTTLKDFVREDGKPGYFSNKLNVYNKKDRPCPICKNLIKVKIIGQRSSYYCGHCQR